MILIADSGSTKTDWMLCHPNGFRQSLQTAGINPYFQSEQEIAAQLADDLKPVLQTGQPRRLFFYGAGCVPGAPAERMQTALHALCPAAEISVESDLAGAARAVCGNQAGIACILGTGSNSCFYDGRQIAQHVPPLGFILGDEGSGACLGKRLVSDLLKNQLGDPLRLKFFERFSLTQAEVVSRVYSQPYPNRFLASLSVFAKENIGIPAVRQLVDQCFADFFTRNVYQYDYPKYPVHVVGSIGYHYETELRQTATLFSVNIGKIVRSPIEGLIDYHLNQI